MLRTGLSVALVACFALSGRAVAEPDEGGASNSSVVSVREYLEQAAESPLGPDDVGLLRAVADLLEKEPVATESAEQRSRQVVRLCNVPAADVAEAMARYVKSERGDRAFFVSEPKSNSLLLSATPDEAAALLELIAKLDVPPATIMVGICIAELTYTAADAEQIKQMPPAAALPAEEVQAWIDEAKKQGRLEIFSQPQIITLNGQPGSIQIGSLAPIVRPENNQVEQAHVGVTVAVTPRITPTGLVTMQVDIEHTRLSGGDAADRADIGKMTIRTTATAEDGQTVFLGGLITRTTTATEDVFRESIITVTPRVNPQR